MNLSKAIECNRRVLLFARYPEKGRVKTRLETHLSQEDILGLYQRFVTDILATLRKSNYPFTICFLPSDRAAEMKAWLGPASVYAPQTGADLGERMGNAFVQAFAAETSPVDQAILIGSDVPDLSPQIIHQAFDSLFHKDMTLGPAVDGGYYLIGFNRHTFFREVFHGIPWGTGQVFQETMNNIRHVGLKVHLLPEWQDIDTFEDLASFYRRANEEGIQGLGTVPYLQLIFSDKSHVELGYV
jgi:rSAM/selenodomain-associated transferase 1